MNSLWRGLLVFSIVLPKGDLTEVLPLCQCLVLPSNNN